MREPQDASLSAGPADAPVDDSKQEVRLALVLNGGVSLAVWMAGVTHELDLLRRASRRKDGGEGLDDRERKVFDIWRQVAVRASSRVVIDTVAGTSAGGLNGMLLATALGRRANLPKLRQVWEESASLDELLAPPSRQSLLDGDYFAGKIKEELGRISDGDGPDEPVSLFMTATALDGRSRSYSDAFGSEFHVRDHRRVYHFQHDRYGEAYRKDGNGAWEFVKDVRADFALTNNAALAQAARASAGFPVAFAPVSEQPMMGHREQPSPVFDDPASCVVDGGVLNNAPFGPVLEWITKRRLNKPVRRIVVYVVPSAGQRLQEKIGHATCSDISFLTTALSAVQYPREADFRTGTQDLSSRLGSSIRDTQQELFERIQRETLPDTPEHEVYGETLRDHVCASAAKLLDEYRLSRAGAVLWETRKRLADAGTVTSLVAMPEADTDTLTKVLTTEPNWSPRYRTEKELTDPNLEQWSWGLIPAQRLCEILSHHLHQRLTHHKVADKKAQRAALIAGASDVSRQLRRAIAVTEAVREELLLRHHPGALFSDCYLSDLIHQVFIDLDVPAQIGAIVRQASDSYARALREAELIAQRDEEATAAQAVRDCLAVEVLTGVYAPPPKVIESPTPAFEFLRLGPDTISRLFHEDRFADLGDRKLYGIRFQHFGAFVDKEWRRSDFAWGRLDAAHNLLSVLASDVIADADELRALQVRLQEAILHAEAPEESEHSPRQWMEDHLNRLKGTDRELLQTKEGKDSLKGAIKSVLRLLSGPRDGAAPGPSGAAARTWGKVLHISRPAIAKEKSELERGDKRWVRWLTWYVRRRTWRTYDAVFEQEGRDVREIPWAFRTALRRTAVGLPVLLVLLGVGIGTVIGTVLW
ncbi:DUF3376 domain-containing protein [Streptomyces sp. P1-3]|uniref:DUF3376 domain-containing protein n=1 Tax=Streptomyces sp. P1-3 TaxID=3421658 RepID=UPI003D36653E